MSGKLFAEIAELEKRLAELRSKISSCSHEWDTSPEMFEEVHPVGDGCSGTPSPYWRQVQHRRCMKCGLFQYRTKISPDRPWSSWEDKK